MKSYLFIAAIVTAVASAPLAVSRREPAARGAEPEIVSLPRASTGPLQLRPAWKAFVALRVAGLPSPDSGSRFIDAFFDGRLPEAAGFVTSALATVDEAGSARIANRSRSFDRALALLRPAPAPLLRVFVERAEDPDAHVEATRAHAEEISLLVDDAALGERAWSLLRAARCDTPPALKALGRRVASDAWARAALGTLGTRAAPVLLEAMDSGDPLRRAAGAWVLAGLGDPAHVERILRTAVPELARDSVPGNAAFAIRALTALGERGRAAVRGLLRSPDDQAVACALQVLMRTGGATADDLDAARSRVERLASRAGEAGDEAAIGLELRSALAVTTGAMTVPDPPEKLNPSQAPTSGRTW